MQAQQQLNAVNQQKMAQMTEAERAKFIQQQQMAQMSEAERAKINGSVGKKVIDQALAGDFKSQELFLRSKGGWSPTHTVNEVDQEVDPDMDESAIDTLLSLLGINDDSSEQEDNI